MMRSILASFLAFGLFAGAPAFAADETFTLKPYKSKKGDKTEHEKTEDSKNNIVISVMGMNNKQDINGSMKEIYTTEILEKKDGDKKPTKLTRTYSTAEKTKKGETTKAVYAGETVLIEKKGGKYEFSIKGKPLKEEDAPELYKSFNKAEDEPQNEDFLPKDPVKVGGTWKVPADQTEKMFKLLGEEMKSKIDEKKSSVSGKLVKAYKKDGAQFGVIELSIDVVLTEIDLGGTFAKTTANSKMEIKITLDTCIDGTVDIEDGKTEAKIDLTAELPNKGSFTISGTSSMIQKSHFAKK